MQKHFLVLYVPLIISNILHMFVVKRDLLSFLKIPLSNKIFGQNKTFRGFVFVPLINGIILTLLISILNIQLPLNGFALGLMLGLAYLIFELPNSLMKRKIGIAPGEKSEKFRNLFIILDRCDSALGVSLLYVTVMNLTTMEFLILFGFAFAVHFFFSFLMVKIGVKESL